VSLRRMACRTAVGRSGPNPRNMVCRCGPLLRPGQFAYLGESDAAARIPCSVTVMPLGVSLTSDSWRSFLMHSRPYRLVRLALDQRPERRQLRPCQQIPSHRALSSLNQSARGDMKARRSL
jgi:hypothetical protein